MITESQFNELIQAVVDLAKSRSRLMLAMRAEIAMWALIAISVNLSINQLWLPAALATALAAWAWLISKLLREEK